MTDEQPEHDKSGEPQHRDDTPPPWPPQWLRTLVVVVVIGAFLSHLAYDTADDGYEGFQTSFLLLGFVGLSLGIDLFGRRG